MTKLKGTLLYVTHVVLRNLLIVPWPLIAYYSLVYLKFTPIQLGMAITVGYLGAAASSALCGSLADLIGLKKVLLLLPIAGGLCWLALAAVSDWLYFLLFYALLSGFGYARHTLDVGLVDQLSRASAGKLLAC